ncbi:MAG: RNA methyltransferase [Dermatophilaceae bacterium]
MLTNIGSDRVRSVRALSRRAVRERESLFMVEGPQAVREVVVHRPEAVKDLYVDAELGDRHAAILEAARTAGASVREVSHEVLAAMCDTLVPQGIVAVCRPVNADLDDVLNRRPRLLLILTKVRDPGNAGTVIRSADAAGADAVLVSASSVDLYNPKVVRSTAGSIFHLPIVTDIPIEVLLARVRGAGLALLAADGKGESQLADIDLSGPHAWVMGNEAWGLESDVQEGCDAVVRLPIYGHAESLNLAMAATICLYASAAVQREGSVSG